MVLPSAGRADVIPMAAAFLISLLGSFMKLICRSNASLTARIASPKCEYAFFEAVSDKAERLLIISMT